MPLCRLQSRRNRDAPSWVQQGLLTAGSIIALLAIQMPAMRVRFGPATGRGSAVAADVFAELLVDFGSLLNSVVEHGAPLFGVLIEIDGAEQEAGLEDDFEGVAQVVGEAANLFGLPLGDRLGLGRRGHE